MVRALPSTDLFGFATGAAARTQPLAGGPAEGTTPILLGDIRNLPGTGNPSNIPLAPAVQPTPPVWPQPPVAQPAPQPAWPQPPVAQPAPQPAWPQPPVAQPPIWQQPAPQPAWPQPPVAQPPVWQPIPGPEPGANGVVGIFGAIAQIGMTVFGGVMSIIDWFKSRRKKRRQPQPQPAPFPVPQPAPNPVPPLAGGNPAPAGAAQVRPAIDPQVAATIAQTNQAIAQITAAVEKLAAGKAVAAGGPANAAPRPLEAPAPAPAPAIAPDPGFAPPPERNRVLMQIMAQLVGLMTTLTDLLAKLVEKKAN